MADTRNDLEAPGDADAYGSKGQKWHADFVAYMKVIVAHPAYAGMPDALKDDGRIQWEAPSNRPPGRYQHTHHRRRDWWRLKARQVGIDPDSPTWISQTAKRIHPTGEKPCKRCGRVLRISYVYPNGHLRRRLAREFPKVEFDPLEEIVHLVQRLVDKEGRQALRKLPALLSTDEVLVQGHGLDLEKWLAWIASNYVPMEPALLSPGAMSNAPDRFDGFHSFNLCCRKTADTGRHETNLRLYSTDRRVFEYWSEGDWIAADRLMGLVDAKFRDHPCADGGVGPPSLDHIGPLSLGFMHRPAFRLLSRAANSAKNNRMTLWDVRHLIESERQGTLVISWYARNLWDARKADARDEERALRLSKLLRDNQRSAMQLLGSLLANEHFVFLASLLELDRADYNVEFDNLRINQDCVTVFDRVLHTTRNTKYAQEQKARRLRVAFDALRIYAAKDNRHMLRITDSQVNDHVRSALQAVEHLPKTTQDLQVELRRLLVGQVAPSDDALREIADRISRHRDASDQFAKSRRALGGAMKVIAQRLSSMWDSERYVRAPFDFEES